MTVTASPVPGRRQVLFNRRREPAHVCGCPPGAAGGVPSRHRLATCRHGPAGSVPHKPSPTQPTVESRVTLSEVLMSKIARWLVWFAAAGALAAAASALDAAVKLPAIISDHMVLQQGTPVRIWGTADPGEAVRVDFQGQTVSTKAAENGKWSAWLQPLAAAGPLEMTIAASNTISIKDVLAGEVWVGSGQSNMEFPLVNAVNHDEEIARADFPLIHLFHVKKAVADQPADDVVGTWQVCSPETIRTFSAVEYFFGRELYHHLHVPMGLIESDWGGTPAQSWTSQPVLESDPALKFVLDDWAKVVAGYPAAKV